MNSGFAYAMAHGTPKSKKANEQTRKINAPKDGNDKKRTERERERARERDNGQKGMQSTFLCMEIIALIVARIFGLRKAQHPLQ